MKSAQLALFATLSLSASFAPRVALASPDDLLVETEILLAELDASSAERKQEWAEWADEDAAQAEAEVLAADTEAARAAAKSRAQALRAEAESARAEAEAARAEAEASRAGLESTLDVEDYVAAQVSSDQDADAGSSEADSGPREVYYFSFGVSPGISPHHRGFHGNVRFDIEFGGGFRAAHRRLAWTLGPSVQLIPYFGRSAPGYAADLVSTATFGPVYLRTGIGAGGGLPTRNQLRPFWHGIGGVAGVGLEFGRNVTFRVGVDYDLRASFRGDIRHTFFLAFRVVCCKKLGE